MDQDTIAGLDFRKMPQSNMRCERGDRESGSNVETDVIRQSRGEICPHQCVACQRPLREAGDAIAACKIRNAFPYCFNDASTFGAEDRHAWIGPQRDERVAE